MDDERENQRVREEVCEGELGTRHGGVGRPGKGLFKESERYA